MITSHKSVLAAPQQNLAGAKSSESGRAKNFTDEADRFYSRVRSTC